MEIKNYIKNAPQLLRHALQSVKNNWAYYLVPLLVGLLLAFVIRLIFWKFNSTEILSATMFYRISGLTMFMFTTLAIYKNIKSFRKDFQVTRLLNVSPSVKNFVTALVFTISSFIIHLVILVLKPANADGSILSMILYHIMMLLFATLISILFGRLSLKFKKIHYFFIGLAVLSFFTLPILFILDNENALITHLLMINPLFYLVDGVEKATLIGRSSIGNVIYHLYFLSFLGLITMLIYAIKKQVTIFDVNQTPQKK
ncbi:sugar ABC transporter permease [Staphylococcus massiliensis]|uniref:sugar ABC transporter permease n=1 Tax=Staphylococcus massiliensis TaxID=555791 RepID=UPI00370D06EF